MSPPPARPSPWSLPALVPIVAVVGVTALVYAPTLGNGFVDFDDQTNLVENPYFRSLGPRALAWMFTHVEGHYIPLTWLSFAIDHQLWGMNPAGYHLTSLLLHLANTVVWYLILIRLLRSAAVAGAPDSWRERLAAACGAAAFALHPLRVESVAWATERRDVLSGLFVLLTIHSYLAAHGAPRERSARVPVAALCWYALSVLAKPVGMTLPLVLVVLDVYPLRRLTSVRAALGRDRAVLIEKVPFVVIGLATAVVEGIAESRLDTFYTLAEHGVGGRVGQAFYVLAFYVAKTIAPFRLSPLYPIPVGWQLWRTDVVVATIAVVAVTALLVRARARHPWALAAWTAYVVLLAPVLGFAQAGPHLAADRYTYLATLGFAAVLAGALSAVGRRGAARAYRAAYAATIAWLAVLAVLTWRQVGVWHDSVALWETAVRVDPECYVCRNNLGNAFLRANRVDDAVVHFRAALAIQPGDADAYANLGNVAERAGRAEDARREYERALAIDPLHASAQTNLGRLLLADGEIDEAVSRFESALRREPMLGEAHLNLGVALLRRGDLDAAERALRRAAEILPDSALAPYDLGLVQVRRGQRAAALESFRRAAALDPTLADPHRQMAFLLDEQGRSDEARAAAQQAERLDPEADVGDGIGAALSLMETGRHEAAIAMLRRLHEAEPDEGELANMLAWLLATAREDSLRDGAAALTIAERALARGDASDPDRLDTLAAAYAELGRFSDAVATARRAVDAARAAGRDDLADESGIRLRGYEAGRPHRLD